MAHSAAPLSHPPLSRHRSPIGVLRQTCYLPVAVGTRGQMRFAPPITSHVSWWVDLEARGAALGGFLQESPPLFEVRSWSRKFDTVNINDA
eukprot:5221803-Pyramimonas_sp.AAC.2